MKKLGQIASRYHLVFQKKHRFGIMFRLLLNRVLMLKLKLFKLLHGIRRPIVHYYAVCWNEEKMLPFVFGYYEAFVDKFLIYDNGSTDQTLEIVNSHPHAQSVHFETDGFDDTVHANIKNNCWKSSRGKADFVVVCDIDEFVFSPSMESFLQDLKDKRVSLPKPHGYSMFSNSFPEKGKGRITEQIRTGVEDEGYSKCLLFDPHRIVEINYEPGAHVCHPLGIVNSNADYKVLHYKNLDIEAVLLRSRINAARLSPANREQNFGYAYLYPEERIRTEFEEGLRKSQNVVS